MTDNEATVAVPVSLLMNMNAIISSDPLIAEPFKRQVHDLLPKPAPRRLRVVDLDAPDDWYDEANVRYLCYGNLESDPDLMTIVLEVIESFMDAESGPRADLYDRIRTAIEEATR